MFRGWTPFFFWAVFSGCCSGRLLVAVALGLGLVAFGSVSVAPGSALGSVPFRWGLALEKERAPTPKPAVICDHFMSGVPSVRCSGTLDLCIRCTASRRTLGCELRDGSDRVCP